MHHMVGIYYSAQDAPQALYLQQSLLEKKEETRAKGPLDCMTVTSLKFIFRIVYIVCVYSEIFKMASRQR